MNCAAIILDEPILNTLQIREFVREHPIEQRDKSLSYMGGPGCRAGMPPSPAIHEFMKLYKLKSDLFHQKDFTWHCFYAWEQWLKNQIQIMKRGVASKLYNNFYPSMIDSIHVHALITQMGFRCRIDTKADVVGGVDVSAYVGSTVVDIALTTGSNYAVQWAHYKWDSERAQNKTMRVVDVPKGDKVWYNEIDFMFLKSIPANSTSLP